MLTIRLKVTGYDKGRNVCQAVLQNGDNVEFDPYVSCAIPLTDEEYVDGDGAGIIGCEYLLTEFTVYEHVIVPHQNGLIMIKHK